MAEATSPPEAPEEPRLVALPLVVVQRRLPLQPADRHNAPEASSLGRVVVSSRIA
jgi:hypothetical protein